MPSTVLFLNQFNVNALLNAKREMEIYRNVIIGECGAGSLVRLGGRGMPALGILGVALTSDVIHGMELATCTGLFKKSVLFFYLLPSSGVTVRGL